MTEVPEERELLCYDKPMHLAAIHLLCLELNLFLSHSRGIMRESLRFLSTVDSTAYCSSKHNGWKLGSEFWLESAFHVRKGETDKSPFWIMPFSGNQGKMPRGGGGGSSSVAPWIALRSRDGIVPGLMLLLVIHCRLVCGSVLFRKAAVWAEPSCHFL